MLLLVHAGMPVFSPSELLFSKKEESWHVEFDKSYGAPGGIIFQTMKQIEENHLDNHCSMSRWLFQPKLFGILFS